MESPWKFPPEMSTQGQESPENPVLAFHFRPVGAVSFGLGTHAHAGALASRQPR